jgi:hypothetical protein
MHVRDYVTASSRNIAVGLLRNHRRSHEGTWDLPSTITLSLFDLQNWRLPGWRVCWVIGPKNLVTALSQSGLLQCLYTVYAAIDYISSHSRIFPRWGSQSSVSRAFEYYLYLWRQFHFF